MSRRKKYLDISVVEAARGRLHHTFDIFDRVVLMFSGGKDSLVCLHLLHQVMEERGETQPLDVIFLDEELLPDPLVDFVAEVGRLSWVRLHWFAVPMSNSRVSLHDVADIVTWDPDRPHVRPMPADAIQLPAGEPPRVFRQQEMDEYVYRTLGLRGKVAYVNGIRADEGLVRYCSVVNKLVENYLVASSYRPVMLCKPVYDWTLGDVFKWLHDERIPWCSVYDKQHLVGASLRISTPLHSESARQFERLAAQDAEFFDRLCTAFPEMLEHARYHLEVSRGNLEAAYEDGRPGCRRYIREHFPLKSQRRRMSERRLKEFSSLHTLNPVAYPWRLLLQHLIRGTVHRTILPLGAVDQERERKRLEATT